MSRSSSQQSFQLHSSSARKGLSAGPTVPQPIAESPVEDDLSAPTAPFYQTNVPFGSTSTLMTHRESMVKNKPMYTNSYDLPRTFSSQGQATFKPMPGTREGSETGSIHNGRNTMSHLELNGLDDDNMTLSQRRTLMRESSLSSLPQNVPSDFDSHQPLRQSVLPPAVVREQRLANWRASVQQDLGNKQMPKQLIERQRSHLWAERQQLEQRKLMESRMKGQRDSAFDERMRKGDFLEAHRDALRRMQATASRNA
jgi:hypothetical protein